MTQLVDFIVVTSGSSTKVINRSAIALIEAWMSSTKITLNILDRNGKNIEIIASESLQVIANKLDQRIS